VEDDLSRQNASSPRDPNTIIESVYDDETETPAKRLRSKGSASTKGKGAAKPQGPQTNSKSKQQHRRLASVEAVDDEDDLSHRNAGRPQDPNTIIKSMYDDEWETLIEKLRSKRSASTKGKGAAKPQGPQTKSKQQHRRLASVEAVDDEDDLSRRNAGRPRDPNTIIESVYDDETETPASKKKVATSRKPSWKAVAEDAEEEDGLQEDADEAELH